MTLTGKTRFTPRALAGIALRQPSGVKGFASAPEVRRAIRPANPLVKDRRGQLVRSRVHLRVFSRAAFPNPNLTWAHPYTLSADWPELREAVTVRELRAEARRLAIPGRSAARTKAALRTIIRRWREA